MPAAFVNASSNIETKCRPREHVPDSEDVSGKISYAASDAFGFGGEESLYDTNTKTK